MLSCSCDFDDSDWYYYGPTCFELFDALKRKRCCSCNELINHNSICAIFDRFRFPYNDIEERILGGEVQIASWFMCEWCSEMYFNLNELGYCHNLGDSIREDLEDYWNLTGFTPKRKEKKRKGKVNEKWQLDADLYR